jgi:hypothetical protein
MKCGELISCDIFEVDKIIYRGEGNYYTFDL